MKSINRIGRRCLPALPILVFAFAPAWRTAAAQTPSWMKTSLDPAARARMLAGAMTLDEKIEQIALNTGPNPDLPGCGVRNDTRHIEGIPRLSIPTVRLTNGPIGVAGGDCNPNPPTTAVPTGLAVAATWDPQASFRWGEIAGRETVNIAHHVFIAPGVNLTRVPQAGRNFEYFGEDPYLAGRMAVEQIKAIQAHGIQAAVKHYVANEQETDRFTMDTVAADRPLRELYLLPFEMAVKDGAAASVMCSYPRIGGVFACENAPLLTGVLRKEWGFGGYIMSDRNATKSTAPSIKAALAAGEIAIADIDAMLIRRFTTMFRLGQFDHLIKGFTPVDSVQHVRESRLIAEQGSVLLKNENHLLPLEAKTMRSIALIGPATFAGAAKLPSTGPRGMITVNTSGAVSPLDGLRNALKALESRATVTFHDGKDLESAKTLAAASDVAIVMAGDISLEGEDRANLSLPCAMAWTRMRRSRPLRR